MSGHADACKRGCRVRQAGPPHNPLRVSADESQGARPPPTLRPCLITQGGPGELAVLAGFAHAAWSDLGLDHALHAVLHVGREADVPAAVAVGAEGAALRRRRPRSGDRHA